MNTTAASRSQSAPGQARATGQENLITVILGLWLIFGFFIDGYAHGNLRGSIESIFTPWHAILYSGFLATSGWMIWMITRRLNQWSGLKAIPVGYELGLVGVFVFGLGGIADLIWHTVFGIEVGLDALRSPSHIMLFIGAILLMTAPLRANWQDPNTKPNPSLLEFLPMLFVVFASFAFTSLMNLHVWGLISAPDSIPDLQRLNTNDPALRYALYSFVDVSILFTNAAMMFIILLLLQRWQTPFGTFGIILGLSTLVLVVIVDTNLMPRVYMAALAGTMIDALIQILRPNPTRVLELRIFAALAPLLIWGSHFLAVQLSGGLGISPELWTGILTMNVLSGLALSLLVAPMRT
jgi:hypothetical protein